MKKVTLFATALLAVANQAQAQLNLLGSDTLEDVTKGLIQAAGLTAQLGYAGTGTTNGENAMVSGAQQISPMSRPVKCSVASQGGKEGKVLAYDGIAVVRSSCDYVNGDCLVAGTTAIPACEQLRVLYFGLPNSGAADCNSAARQALVNNWDALFQGSQGESCTQLRHAFRRDDASGTTDTLKSICGVSSSQAFCNGNSNQDNDPIRRPAPASQYDVARADGTLGVVLPIAVPAVNPFSDGAAASPAGGNCDAAGVTTGTTRCSSGAFRFRSYPGFGRCPDGQNRRGNLCRVPVISSTASARCVNTAGNRPLPSATQFDGRLYNNQPRNDDGSIVAQNGYYRIHETRSVVGATCKESDSTTQIGCLARAEGCSVGYAGRETLQIANTRRVQLPATVGGACTDPTPTAIVAGTYPLSRKLYLATLKGFGAVTGAEGQLANFVQNNESTVESIVTQFGFVADPAGGIRTEQFVAPTCAP